MLLVAWRLGNRGFQALAGCIAAVFGLVALLSSAAAGQNRQAVIVLAVAVPLAGWAGYARRTHAESQARDEATEAIAGSLLEHTARGERARISRELHDVVAHHISMIAVQAETARLATPGMPEAGAERLSAIGDTARAALTEMRRLLGVLREDTEIASPVRQPQPGLDQLAELVDQARDAAGVGARLIISGSPTRLDPGVELAAFRIVQEALTNARRHAPGAAVDVELRYHGSGLYLRVRDNGPGLAAAASPAETGAEGHGLLGMRERATAVGGRLQAGPAPGGGFMIEVSLPAEAEEDAA
jgi:signal transduction histidine kinase